MWLGILIGATFGFLVRPFVDVAVKILRTAYENTQEELRRRREGR